jgi:hypothetical protein
LGELPEGLDLLVDPEGRLGGFVSDTHCCCCLAL